MNQHTIGKKLSIKGKGLHTGQETTLTFHPAPINHGYKFKRIDLDQPKVIPVDPSKVVATNRCTTLGVGSVKVQTVEHVLSALVGCGIDNVLLEIDGEEIEKNTETSSDMPDANKGEYSKVFVKEFIGDKVILEWKSAWDIEGELLELNYEIEYDIFDGSSEDYESGENLTLYLSEKGLEQMSTFYESAIKSKFTDVLKETLTVQMRGLLNEYYQVYFDQNCSIYIYSELTIHKLPNFPMTLNKEFIKYDTKENTDIEVSMKSFLNCN